MIRTISILSIALLLASTVADALPKPAKSEYFETIGAGFQVKKDEGLFYAMTYKVLQPLEEPAYATITFQNPSDKKNPFIVHIVLSKGNEDVLVQSPTFGQIKNNKNYKVRFDLYTSEPREQRLNTHNDKVNFSLPTAMAAQLGIELL